MQSHKQLIIYFSLDFSGSPEPLVSTSFGNFLTNPSLDDSVDVKTEGPGTHFSDCVFKPQVKFQIYSTTEYWGPQEKFSL